VKTNAVPIHFKLRARVRDGSNASSAT